MNLKYVLVQHIVLGFFWLSFDNIKLVGQDTSRAVASVSISVPKLWLIMTDVEQNQFPAIENSLAHGFQGLRRIKCYLNIKSEMYQISNKSHLSLRLSVMLEYVKVVIFRTRQSLEATWCLEQQKPSTVAMEFTFGG